MTQRTWSIELSTNLREVSQSLTRLKTHTALSQIKNLMRHYMLNGRRPFQLIRAVTRHCETSRMFVDSSIGGDDNDACIRNKNISVCLAPFYPLVGCRFKRVKYPPPPTKLNDLMLSYDELINMWWKEVNVINKTHYKCTLDANNEQWMWPCFFAGVDISLTPRISL